MRKSLSPIAKAGRRNQGRCKQQLPESSKGMNLMWQKEMTTAKCLALTLGLTIGAAASLFLLFLLCLVLAGLGGFIGGTSGPKPFFWLYVIGHVGAMLLAASPLWSLPYPKRWQPLDPDTLDMYRFAAYFSWVGCEVVITLFTPAVQMFNRALD
jgi:hypothetical protein